MKDSIEIKREFKNVIYWLKAASGQGKSTIPHYMLENSKDENVETIIGKSGKVIATIFKEFNMASLGPYKKGATFGGVDSLNKEQVEEALEILKDTKYDIYVEGLISGIGTLGTGKPRSGKAYYEILKTYPRETKAYLFIETEWEYIVERIKTRTGKTDEEIEKLKNAKSKYNALEEHKEEFIEKFLKDF